jgi:hypothetical protein
MGAHIRSKPSWGWGDNFGEKQNGKHLVKIKNGVVLSKRKEIKISLQAEIK